MMPMVPPGAQSPSLSLEQARASLKECADLLDAPEVQAQMQAARQAAGPDPMMAMMLVRRARARRGSAARQGGFRLPRPPLRRAPTAALQPLRARRTTACGSPRGCAACRGARLRICALREGAGGASRLTATAPSSQRRGAPARPHVRARGAAASPRAACLCLPLTRRGRGLFR